MITTTTTIQSYFRPTRDTYDGQNDIVSKIKSSFSASTNPLLDVTHSSQTTYEMWPTLMSVSERFGESADFTSQWGATDRMIF